MFKNMKYLEYKKFVPLHLQRELEVVHVNTINDDAPDFYINFCLWGHCYISYEKEIIKLTFHNINNPWCLKKLSVYYKDVCIHSHVFNNDGIYSVDYSNVIDFQFNIGDLNIGFYDDTIKTIMFKLNFTQCNGVYETKYAITFPQTSSHHQLCFKNTIDFYHPEKSISSFFDNNYELSSKSSEDVETICREFEDFRKIDDPQKRYETFGYCKMFQRMLNIEDLTVRKALDDLIMHNKVIGKIPNFSGRFSVKFDGKKISESLSFNHLVLTPMELYEKNKNNMKEIESSRIYNTILNISDNTVIFEKPKNKFINVNLSYHVELIENRVSLRLAHKALHLAKTFNLEEFLTSLNTDKLKVYIKKDLGIEYDWVFKCCNKNVARNMSQVEAVKNIVNRTAFPLPYVIFGPPGTGKTSTLVEAVAQIVKLQPGAHILITANSNSACDEIGERLLNFVPRYKMYRLYSSSFDNRMPERYARIHPLLKPISNIKNLLHKNPSYEEIYNYKVVIATLVTCGRLISANIDPAHFDYIFIDECASTMEPHSIIPIIGLGAQNSQINASIVLAGDHMQLGPIIHSHFNEVHGLGMSFMERIMMLKKYQKFPFDSNFVTQLTENYRSHFAILRFSNVQFYHSALTAKQTPEIANFACGWEMLPNKDFPIIFHSILDPSETEGTSLYNLQEIMVVTSYIEVLLEVGINGKAVHQSDIAIICPYSAQRRRLQDAFKIYPDIEIGTVDYYQGREKKIIIFSTVRSKTWSIGFLKNEKRMNVALTRAKSLLIVVGNAETLQKNKLWYKFINMCHKKNALVGENFMLKYRKLHDESTTYFPEVNQEAQEHERSRIDHDAQKDQNEGSQKVVEQGLKDKKLKKVDSKDVSDSTDEADSDVSWTHEDFRMKNKTAKINVKTDYGSILPDLKAVNKQKHRDSKEKKAAEELGNICKTSNLIQASMQDFKRELDLLFRDMFIAELMSIDLRDNLPKPDILKSPLNSTDKEIVDVVKNIQDGLMDLQSTLLESSTSLKKYI